MRPDGFRVDQRAPVSALRSRWAALFSATMAATLLAGTLAGCQQLFTTSLAASLARPDLPIPSNLTPSQASDLAKKAKSNPKLAKALVSSLVSQIATTTDPAVKASLEASAAGAAVVASGTSAAITSLVSAAASGTIPDTQTLSNLLTTIQAGATPDVVAALSYLDPSTGLSSDAATASGLGATDLAVAAVVVAASALPPNVDPSNLTASDAATFVATPQAASAQRLINEANALVPPDSAGASQLAQISSYFSITSVPTTI